MESGARTVPPFRASAHILPTISIDLAYKRLEDIGIAVLEFGETRTSVTLLPTSGLGVSGTPNPQSLADGVARLAQDAEARLLFVDGPQGWKSPKSKHEHCRACERELNTPAKTGVGGHVKPRNYFPFVSFSIDFFDALDERGWGRLFSMEPSVPQDGGLAIESFPASAWKALGQKPLPAKSRCTPEKIEEKAQRLAEMFGFSLLRIPNHDELQALVAGLAGRPIERPYEGALHVAGVPPAFIDGHWQEGYIVNPAHP